MESLAFAFGEYSPAESAIYTALCNTYGSTAFMGFWDRFYPVMPTFDFFPIHCWSSET